MKNKWWKGEEGAKEKYMMGREKKVRKRIRRWERERVDKRRRG